MRIIARLAVGLVAVSGLLIGSVPAVAQGVPEYEAIRAARPDGRRIPVSGLTLVRDAYRVELVSGVVHLLAPVDGVTFGGVFFGEGTYRLAPATDSERQHLRLVTGEERLEALTDEFDSMLLLFTDDSDEELLAHAPLVRGAPDKRATDAYEDLLELQAEEIHINFQLRIVSDLLNRPGRLDGVFLGWVDGDDYGPALIAIDPLGISNLSAQFRSMGGEETALVSFHKRNGGFWYLSQTTEEAVPGRGKAVRPWVDAEDYAISTTLDGHELVGRAAITLTPLVDGIRVLPVNIFHKLRIHAAVLEDDPAVELGLIQEEFNEGLFGSESGDADAAIVFPDPLVSGAPIRLRIDYEGRDVLQGYDGSYSVGARDSWYPNFGTFSDLATYAMSFNYPRRETLVATGRQVSEKAEGNRTATVWRSDVPIRVAGFNYGEFRVLSRTDEETGLELRVYTNPRRSRMAEDTMADAMNASRVATMFFGPTPYAQLSVSQQRAWNFGQSWPSLVFLPEAALTGQTERVNNFDPLLDPRQALSMWEFVDTVGWHEVAHQWWGHQVGWASYRDQWLSEGFSEFTSALTLEFTEGSKRGDDFWENRRNEILDRRGAVANHAAGAMTQGFRLGTRRSPGAATAMIYAKGGYVLHMLRMMMRPIGQSNPDEGFINMMHEFVASWAGKNPSTDDFQAIAQRHMSSGMDLVGDGTLDYFFDQWVRGTDIPRLRSTLEVTDVGDGQYRVSGEVSQEEVPAGFRTLVPVYLDFGENQGVLGRISLSGPMSQAIDIRVALPQRPRRVTINAMHDVLTR